MCALFRGSINNIGGIPVYLSLPYGKPKTRGGVFLIHDWWGLDTALKQKSDQIARWGYPVCSIDLFNGQSAKTPEEASALFSGVNPEATLEKISRCLLGLQKIKGFQQVIAMGWSLGATYALLAALSPQSMVQAAISYYGSLPQSADELRHCRVPLFCLVGRRDGWITQKMVQIFRNACRRARVNVECVEYDAGHAFADPRSKTFDKLAAQDAEIAVRQFLKRQLGKTNAHSQDSAMLR